jgi:hypothetical protein
LVPPAIAFSNTTDSVSLRGERQPSQADVPMYAPKTPAAQEIVTNNSICIAPLYKIRNRRFTLVNVPVLSNTTESTLLHFQGFAALHQDTQPRTNPVPTLLS